MSRVIEVSSVRTRLSLQDDEGINDAISSALDGALARLSSVLATSFDREEHTDVFYLDPAACTSVAGLVGLRLSNGFVQGPITVVSGDSLAEVLTGGSSETVFLLNAEKGHVKVPDALSGKYVRVSYESGFSDGDEAPAWLKEVVLAHTIMVMSSQQISDGQAELSKVVPVVEKHSTDTLDRHLRNGSLLVYPLN